MERLSRGEITEQQATAMVDHLPYVLPNIVPCLALRQRALNIAIALDHPTYDGFYIALALERSLKLVTADKRLLERVQGTPWQATVVHIKSAVAGSLT